MSAQSERSKNINDAIHSPSIDIRQKDFKQNIAMALEEAEKNNIVIRPSRKPAKNYTYVSHGVGALRRMETLFVRNTVGQSSKTIDLGTRRFVSCKSVVDRRLDVGTRPCASCERVVDRLSETDRPRPWTFGHPHRSCEPNSKGIMQSAESRKKLRRVESERAREDVTFLRQVCWLPRGCSYFSAEGHRKLHMSQHRTSRASGKVWRPRGGFS